MTENTMAKGTNNDLQNTTQKTNNWARKVWRYQRGNQKPQIEEQTIRGEKGKKKTNNDIQII